MKNIFLIAALIICVRPSFADPRVNSVPAELALVQTLGSYRLVAFQTCSPEHCWNELFIQELENTDDLKVICSAAVSELNATSDAVIRTAKWRKGSEPAIELALASSHEAFKPYTALLSLKRGCKYKLRPSPRAGS
jgi:hypothetical protein